MKCPHCQTDLALVVASGEQRQERPASDFVKVPDADAFRNLCELLLKSPNCRDTKFRSALEDFPGNVRRYGRLTAGQAKFFKAIHKEVFGRWPPDLDKLSARELDHRRDLPEDVPF